MDVRLVLEQSLQEFHVDRVLGPGGRRGQHEGSQTVSAAGQVHGGTAAQQHLGGGVVAQPDALVERGLLRLRDNRWRVTLNRCCFFHFSDCVQILEFYLFEFDNISAIISLFFLTHNKRFMKGVESHVFFADRCRLAVGICLCGPRHQLSLKKFTG